MLAAAAGARADQQTFSSVSSGKAPAPQPTQTSMGVPGLYLGVYPNQTPHPYHTPRPPHPPQPCPGGRCPPPARRRTRAAQPGTAADPAGPATAATGLSRPAPIGG